MKIENFFTLLPKPYRLTEKRDFKRVMTYGRSFFIKELGIKYIVRKDTPHARIAIIVPKKITKTIARRNRIKRQIRHIFIELLDKLHHGSDIILLARASIMELEFDAMRDKIETILKKLKLYAP